MAESGNFLIRHRLPIQALLDGLAWAVALTFAAAARYDFALSRIEVWRLVGAIGVAALAQALVGVVAGLYIGRWRFGSFEEVLALVRTTLVTSALLYAVNVVAFSPPLVPRSLPVGGGVAALVAMAGTRYGWRLRMERRRRPDGESCERLLVFGAGEGGVQIVTALLKDPGASYLPVALLDDDPSKRRLRIMGVPVVGGRSRLAEAAAEHDAESLLIAIPLADSALVTELSELAVAAGLHVKVLPPASELFGDEVGVSDIREVTTADLLGRREIEVDVASIAGYLTDRRVLVTGAGGSIGSELCRQIYRFAPARLIMVDRDESALHAVQLSIHGRALLDTPDLVLLDLRDRTRLERLLADQRPEVIFHAAALKHLTLLERHPGEAVRTNVWATLDLLEAAQAAGVDRFVNISTDKAADPTSVLGYTKRIAERLTAHCAWESALTCLSVRFGNVLGSRGSVLTAFQSQIDRGGPITVTDPEVTRYFMTVEEAVRLVIQAGAVGHPGEALILDMGEPVRIAEVARLLAARSERPVAIEYTGLRGGEKLEEVRLGAGEHDRRPVHPMLSHVVVPPLDPALVRSIDIDGKDDALIGRLIELCSTLQSPASA